MLHFGSPILLGIGLLLVVTMVAAGVIRRIAMRPLTQALIVLGALAVALAAGDPIVNLRQRPDVAVLIDVSPSTRGALFREPGVLKARISPLLGDHSFRVHFLADGIVDGSLDRIDEIPTEQTRLAAPGRADAVLLLSDGQFTAPAWMPPTYPLIDPGLAQITDGRVERLEIDDQTLKAAVRNSGTGRTLTFAGTQTPTQHIERDRVAVAAVPETSKLLTARLNPGDSWGENDSLSIYVPPDERSPRWWMGDNAPAGWTRIDPANFAPDPASLLEPSVIVLNNVPADSLSLVQQERLQQYVRDLGGGLVILGGPHAFAAGGYPGTVIESLSPLSSTPPTPTTHWVVLVDSSGSMGVPEGTATRWTVVSQAAAAIVSGLPPNDSVSIGSFARDLRWWSQGRSARETSQITLPPDGIEPTGPTNLQLAMQSIVASLPAGLPTEVLIISDADTSFDPSPLVTALRSRQVRVHLLGTSKTPSDNPVRRLVEATGGNVIEQPDARRWTTSLRKLLRAAAPPRISSEPIEVRFAAPLAAIAPLRVSTWNQVWARESITPLGVAATSEGKRILAALWNAGAGRVAAAAFSPPPPIADELARLVAAPPRDPRYRIRWDCGPMLRVRIDAVESDRLLNDLAFRLQLLDDRADAETQFIPIPQIAPGRYELSVPAPRRAVIGVVGLADGIISRHAIAGRYAPEFDEIGLNRRILERLAATTGGRVIEPGDVRPIEFASPGRRVHLTGWLAAAGALFIAAGLVHWRLT